MGIEDLFKGIGPVPAEVKEAFKGTDFFCSCGGMVIPQTMDDGICFSCKTTLKLIDCDYETEEDNDA